MKGMINEDGILVIYRKGEWIEQYCPYELTWCGHWCSLFSEPKEKDGRVYLELCRKTLVFDEFKDRRK